MKNLTKTAAAFFTSLGFVSFMMTCALYGDHPVAFLHSLLLTIGCALIVAALLPLVVKYE